MAESFDRVLPLSGMHNFRDYGGYAGADGAHVKTGKLYRSAHPYGATEQDLTKVLALKLAAVVDLRGASERVTSPSPWPHDFSAQVIETNDETASLAPHLKAIRGSVSTEQAVTAMTVGYRGMPFQPILVDLFTRNFAALATVEQPALIHCMAGKDRTGLGVALVHHLLGVHHDDMMADYLLTNTVGDTEARIAAGVKAGLGVRTDGTSEAVIRVMMMVQPAYLDAAFAAIDERHGSVDAYLRDVLAVDDTRRETIRARLLT